MDVILDTNIFRSDVTLKSKDIDALLDYLDRTDSRIILPQIILDETIGLYKRTLSERIRDFEKVAFTLNSTLVHDIEMASALDIEEETKKYISFIKKRLNIHDHQVLPYNNTYLPEISRRAIERIKPCGNDGQGFRDTMIWLATKQYAKSSHEKQVVFISFNTADFAEGKDNALNEALEKECLEEDTKVNYFKSIKDFISNHSTRKIDHIDFEWIDRNLNFNEVAEHFCEMMNLTPSHLISSFERLTGNECTGYLNAFKAHHLENIDIFIYEMIDNSLIVNMGIRLELELELEYYLSDYRLHEKPSYDTKMGNYCLETEIHLEITLVDNNIKDWDISEWDFHGHWH